MKKAAIISILLVSFFACDDGKIEVQNPNFDSVTTVSKCTENNLLYKTKANDALLWNVSVASAAIAFANDITPENEPRLVTLTNTSNALIYRAYDAEVLPTKICGIVPDALPNVKEEWITNSGIAEVVTTLNKVKNADTGFERITGYSHSINFKNLVFQTPNGNRIENTRSFGSFSTAATALPFTFVSAGLYRSDCGTNQTKLINSNANASLVLSLNPTAYSNLIKNEVTTTPRTVALNSVNTLSYTYFFGQVSPAYFCATTVPSNPTIIETWAATNSTAADNGVIEVTTTTVGSQFEHTVILKNVFLKRGNTTFALGTNFLLGKFFTNN